MTDGVGPYTRYPRAILWLVREGEVRIGGPGTDAGPAFTVHVSSFYLAKTPITNRQYQAYDPAFHRSGVAPHDDDPAMGLSWADAAGYCAWYARVARKPIRLPTELEWEYACRAGSTARYFWGDDPEAGTPHLWEPERDRGRLALLRPSPFGLIGMLGGVWEWTGSLHRPYPAREGDGRDDPLATGPRVLRGGSFLTPPAELDAGRRRAGDPGTAIADAGFRIARSF